MRYRLLDLLLCNHCQNDFFLFVEEAVREQLSGDTERRRIFTCRYYCSRFNIKNPRLPPEKCLICSQIVIKRGSIFCKKCGIIYKLQKFVPDFTEKELANKIVSQSWLVTATERTYSYLWGSVAKKMRSSVYHYDKMQEVIPEDIVRGKIGLEIGCGFGSDTQNMSLKNPDTEIIAIDLSDGVYKAQDLNMALKNVHIIKASILDLPLRKGIFDFCYSFGVIHHTCDPNKCFNEISMLLRSKGKTFLYLYEDHKDNKWKRYPVLIISLLRKVSVKMDRRLLYFLCMLASPIIFIIFSFPAIIFRRFNKTKKISNKIPFNFGKAPFSLTPDLYDRFGAPIELRFNKINLNRILEKTGFNNIKFTRLQASAGLVAWAEKI